MTVEIVPVGIALLSVVVAVWFGFKNQRLARENTNLQKRLLELEETRERARLIESRKADLVARLILGRHPQFHAALRVLRIENSGASEARDIVVKLDGHGILEHSCLKMSRQDGAEVRQVGPHSSFQYDLVLFENDVPPTEMSISWSDDSGQPGLYHTSLTW